MTDEQAPPELLLQIAAKQNNIFAEIEKIDKDFSIVRAEYKVQRRELLSELETSKEEWRTGYVQPDMFNSEHTSVPVE